MVDQLQHIGIAMFLISGLAALAGAAWLKHTGHSPESARWNFRARY